LSESLDPEQIGPYDWRALANRVDQDPKGFLGSLAYLDKELAATELVAALEAARQQQRFPQVVEWSLIDHRRITPVPPGHWLWIRDEAPFCATLESSHGVRRNERSILTAAGHIASFPPASSAGDARLLLERYALSSPQISAAVRFLPVVPIDPRTRIPDLKAETVLLTNGIGAMARLCVDLGRIQSKYDCLLGANLNPNVPVDRHIFAKRVRVWANAHGFLSGLNADNLLAFDPGPPAQWRFAANAGDGWAIEIEVTAEMVPGQNTTVLRFRRANAVSERARKNRFRSLPSDTLSPAVGAEDRGEGESLRGPAVCLTVRVDVEDRNFHWETKRNSAADHHFSTHTRPLKDRPGFVFSPAAGRALRVFIDSGSYHPQPEWCEDIPHPIEASRGQVASGDAYSPGWFDLPLIEGRTVALVVTAERESPRFAPEAVSPVASERPGQSDEFAARLVRAGQAFVVRRGRGKTVIAGYPWFLDWGRDTLICARGLLEAGMVDEVTQILVTFARFEDRGTLPNTIFGDDASNRDTSDAPLWFGVVCEEVAALSGEPFYSTVVNQRGRTMAEVLESIARHYRKGTPNGIGMDRSSGLVWSPSHYTWMDTNHPACTPREGYPIEIQALWIRLLRQLERRGVKGEEESWGDVAARAEASLQKLYWFEDRGWFADLLIAKAGEPAAVAAVDTALRSNCLFVVSLGLIAGQAARRCVDAALRYLVVPGALRSLAPLPVSPPLTIPGADGRGLMDPKFPYCGRYEGDEDTRRKPAYHNGTAWTWTLPVFCEALARAWDFSPEAVAAAKAYLAGMDRLSREGCLGQVPELLDGDAPHQQRGCDAQAWGVTEALRVWRLLQRGAEEP
jgi:predicted glycogen debranching enzyme